ncbi:hypothetical protein Hanom_Chr07g00668891 [Helianthus anomalus]
MGIVLPGLHFSLLEIEELGLGFGMGSWMKDVREEGGDENPDVIISLLNL